MKRLPKQDPRARLDYNCDWTAWLREGETITTSTWSISPAGPTLAAATNTGGKPGVWLSGLTRGTDYTLTNAIVTSQGREDDRSGQIFCDDR